jgi:Protein of unknown function (DUF5661)
MSDRAHFAVEEAGAAGERIGIDWVTSPFDVEQFRIGMDVELEHGTQDLETNVTDDDVAVTAKIARAHLNESRITTPAWPSWRPRRRPIGARGASSEHACGEPRPRAAHRAAQPSRCRP